MSHTCPWWFGYFLLNPFRRLVQGPARVLGPFVRPGRVVAIDRQEKMVEGLRVARRPRVGPNKAALLAKPAA